MLGSTHWYRMANAEDAMYSQGLPQGVATNIMLFMLNLKYLEVNFHGLKVIRLQKSLQVEKLGKSFRITCAREATICERMAIVLVNARYRYLSVFASCR